MANMTTNATQAADPRALTWVIRHATTRTTAHAKLSARGRNERGGWGTTRDIGYLTAVHESWRGLTLNAFASRFGHHPARLLTTFGNRFAKSVRVAAPHRQGTFLHTRPGEPLPPRVGDRCYRRSNFVS
jgi:hypothetical protein